MRISWLANKIDLPAREYLVVQQIYRGWAWLGIAVVGALLAAAALASVQRSIPVAFALNLGAAACIGLSLVIFFVYTSPANEQTRNWTVLPAGWEVLRRQWEYSHAASAVLYFAALLLLVLALLVGRGVHERA